MNESEIVDYYRDIITIADGLVPVEWEHLIVGANIGQDDAKLLFFFYSTEDEPQNFQAGLAIPDKYVVDEDAFDESVSQMMQRIMDLQEWFVDNHQDPFYELTLKINSAGKLDSHIGYIDWFDADNFTSSDQINFFATEHHGITPKGWGAKRTIKKMKKYEESHR